MSRAEQTLTGEIVDYVHALTYQQIPVDVRQELKRCVLDGVAVILSGAQAASSRIVHQYIGQTMPGRSASVLGTNISASASLAALANGVAGHAEDYDDTQLSSSPDRVYGLLTHPTVPALAAALAVGEECDASGEEFLTAFCAGFEVECKIAEAINPSHYVGGHHTTGTIGTFAAVMGAAKLWRLSERTMRHALGIAASKSAGIRVNFGTMTKPYHAGAAAENGVTAAHLAQLGFEADLNALDGEWGYFQVAGGGCDPERLLGKLGNPYTLSSPGVSVKPYPCGSLAHPSMDTVLDLILEHDIRPEQVAEIRLGAGNNILGPLRYHEPRNALEAKFSLEFCLGILVLRRQARLEEFTDDVVRSPEAREMMRLVHPYHSPETENRGAERILSLVELQLKDGRTLRREAATSRGQPDRPMSPEELERKFRDCAKATLSPDRVPVLLGLISKLEELPSVRELARSATVD